VLLLAGGDEDEAFACLLKELGPRSIFTKAAFEMLVSRAGKATEIEKQLAECRRERQIKMELLVFGAGDATSSKNAACWLFQNVHEA